jgi:hypothetical protein
MNTRARKGGFRVLNAKKALAAAVAGLTLGITGAAFAVGGPNEAGQSEHFQPQSQPCQGPQDQPNCPGPH